jgi:hypothetical protein
MCVGREKWGEQVKPVIVCFLTMSYKDAIGVALVYLSKV